MAGEGVKRVRGDFKGEGAKRSLVFRLPGVRRGKIKLCVEGRRVAVEGEGRSAKYTGVRVLKRIPRTLQANLRDGEVELLMLEESVDPEEIQRLRAERGELKRRLNSLQRDLELLRKRAEEEKKTIVRENTSRSALKIIEALDGVERALKGGGEGEGVMEGLELLKRNLMRVLKGMGVEEIEAEGRILDPLYHHAVKTVVDSEREEDTIVEVLQKGYTLEGQVIRPAMVIVSKREGGDEHGKGAGN